MKNFNEAFKQLHNEAELYSDTIRRQNALSKAIILLETLEYSFDGQVLSFVSPESNEPRKVTRHGCSTLCKCGNVYSYHHGLFAIIACAEETARINLSGLEMAQFFDSLPKWVSDADSFSLWMMSERERKVWLESNAPYLKTGSGKRPESYGAIRI